MSDLFILLLPTAFDAVGSFCLWIFKNKGVRFIQKKVSDLFILILPTAFDTVGKKKVSDLFIILLPTAFDVVGSFCFYFFFEKRCQIYLFSYSRLRLTRSGVFIYEKKVSDLFILLLPKKRCQIYLLSYSRL